jgi:CheY-specific phosphatase CheX/HAMP domain-containing protein
MEKDYKAENKRTLKRRIRKLISIINFYSLLVMLISLIFLFSIAVRYLGEISSKNIAKQMSKELVVIWPKAVNALRIDNDFLIIKENIADLENNNYDRIFRLLGEKYILSTEIDERLKDLENANLEALLDESAAIRRNISKIRMVDYKVVVDDTVIYSSENEDNGLSINTTKFSKIVNFLSKETVETVKFVNTTSVIQVKVRISPTFIIIGYALLLLAALIIFFITVMISKIFASAFSSMIIRPLKDLEYKINNLAEGKIEAAMDTEIVFKRPIREVESLANSTNKIMSKMSEYVGLLENQKEELEAQNVVLAENSTTLTSMNAALANNHSKLKNILDHVEQGLLTFNNSLLINNEYSMECERIFSGSIADNKLSSLIYPNDDSMQRFIDDVMQKIFLSDSVKRSLYVSLLPEEVIIDKRNISISYKIVTDEKNEDVMMIILNDITEKRKLEEMMDSERNILKMVVKSIISRNEFLQLANEYRCFCEEDFNILNEVDYGEILRKVHNFKGNFSQYDMINVVKKLDELENNLYNTSTNNEILNLNGEQLYSWLNDDLEIIESYAGMGFLKDEEMFYIKKSKLSEIEEKLRKTLPSYDYKTILPLIKSLSYKSVKELLLFYPNYVDKLSQRLVKSIKPMEITGDAVFIDTNYYSEISKVLVHVFRNCVDHGIESEDERLEKGKEQVGCIKCSVSDLGDNFSITISDDGKGIDIDSLERKCIELSLCTESDLNTMSYEEKLNFIFEQGVTTKTTASTISGRGVGMTAVKEAIIHLGGSIQVASKTDTFTSFVITLPKIDESEDTLITPQHFMKEMIKTAKSILNEQIDIDMFSGEIKEENIIALNKVTSLINLKGTINSIVMISANEPMAKKLVDGFIIEEISAAERNEYCEDVIGEFCNTILGNTFGIFEDNSDDFQISIPAMISNKGAYLKYTDSDILTCNLEYEEFQLSINMLLQEDIQEVLRRI